MNFELAKQMILKSLPEPMGERVRFEAAGGRVLAEEVVAGMDVPPFRRAAVDGVALRSADVPGELAIIGECRAGGQAAGPIAAGQAVTITTGATVPEGADAVQMIEQVQLAPDGRRVMVPHPAAPGQNVVPRGFEAAAGATVLEIGRVLGPAEMAVLATFGHREVTVCRQPRVALIATGDELVEADVTPGPGQIRNSNTYSLTAQLGRLGIRPDYLGIAEDNLEDLRRKIAAGLEHDAVIISGGASVGPYDLVKNVFRELGIEIIFDQVAVRPGKPTIFARKGERLVFGLPGNPVSSFVSFENFVRPALGRMCGMRNPDLMHVRGELTANMRQAGGRTALLPALATWESSGWQIAPLPWKGSGDIIGFSNADALVIFPADRSEMAQSEKVEALLLPDYWMRRR